jgi:hypothetical protein
MNCQTFEQYLVDYLEGTLSAQDTRDVDAHLQQCVTCRTLLAQEQAISTTLRQWPALHCPDSVIEKVLTEIGSREPRISWRERLQGWLMLHQLWKMGATAAAVVALVVIAMFYFGGDNLPVQRTTFSPDEVEQAKQDIALTLAYVNYYTKKAGIIVEHQLASTETIVRQPVQAALAHQMTSAQTAVRQPVQMVRPVPKMIEDTVTSTVKKTFTSIFDGGTL